MPEPLLDIRRLSHPSAEELELLARLDREAFGDTGLRPYDLGLMARAGVVLLAYLQEELVGGCQLMRMADEPHLFWVVGLYIRPEWRSRGLGRQFLQRVIQLLPTLGASGLKLTVDVANEAARELYVRCGFVLLEEVPEFYGRGEDRHLMSLEMTKTEWTA